jgi:two-component system cell cycle response regulator
VTDWDSDTNVTHETEVPSPSTTVRDRASLVVLAGPRVGTLVRIEGRELIIGRSLRAELCVDDDGVSRHHARIRPGDGGIWIEDLESRNGTFVNGVKVTTPVRLEDGDKIHVGRSSIVKFTYHDALDDSFQERVVVSALRDPLRPRRRACGRSCRRGRSRPGDRRATPPRRGTAAARDL